MTNEFNKRFLSNTDSSGRFIVYSQVTGKKYYVEPQGGSPIQWGDVNPATKKIEGSYGDKYEGSTDKSESLITEENGFIKITTLGPDESPMAEIERRDKQYELLRKIQHKKFAFLK